MQEKITQELQHALDDLRSDIDRVELWAAALNGCAQPLPDYESPFRNLTIPAHDVRF